MATIKEKCLVVARRKIQEGTVEDVQRWLRSKEFPLLDHPCEEEIVEMQQEHTEPAKEMLLESLYEDYAYVARALEDQLGLEVEVDED